MIQDVIDLQNTNEQLKSNLQLAKQALDEKQKELEKVFEYISLVKNLESEFMEAHSELHELVVKHDTLLDQALRIKKSMYATIHRLSEMSIKFHAEPKGNKIKILALNLYNNLKRD